MKAHKLQIAAAILVVAGLLGATQAAGTAFATARHANVAANKSHTTKLTVGLLRIADAGGYWVATYRGFFAKHHLRVAETTDSGGATLIPAIESGANQVGFSNLVSVLQAATKHLGMECLAGTLKKPAVGHELSLLVSPKDASSIKDAKDLEGKTVAVNTLDNINQLLAEDYMATHGATYKSVHFVAMTFPDMPSALVKGTIDAAITDEPATTLAIKTGAKVLSARPYQTITKEPVFSCWLAKTTWVDSHKLAAREFVAALEEADSYIAKHPHYLRSILPKYAKLPAAIANVITMPIITTQITAAILTKWEKVALRFGMLKHDVKVKSLIAHLGS